MVLSFLIIFYYYILACQISGFLLVSNEELLIMNDKLTTALKIS